MQDRVFIADYLASYFDELEPKEFYRAIFPAGELASHSEIDKQGKYNAIAVELLPKEEDRKNARRYVITDELDILDKLQESKNFIIVSPISYIGKSRQAKNARFIYAIAIDLDGITEQHYLTDLFHQIENEFLPKPTYIVWSGSGIHLYYQFEQPIPCFNNVTKQLAALKEGLTRKIWNGYVTSLDKKPQIQSLFQGFRMCGSITKGGSRVRAFEIGEKVSIEYLNQFVYEKDRVKDIVYKSKLTKKEAAAKYPDWYEKRIVKGQPKGTWTCKRDLFDWWLNRLHNEIQTGHRYYGIMCLCVYAKKCGISREEIEAAAFALVDEMEQLTTEENNHFTREDVLAALEMYNDNYITFPIDTITQLTALPIEKNKRNYRKQEVHLKIIRSNKAILKEEGLMKQEGRPTKEAAVKEWRRLNPKGTKADCIRETQISKKTVYKYWE